MLNKSILFYIFKTLDNQIKLISYSGETCIWDLPSECPDHSYWAAKWWLIKRGYRIKGADSSETKWGRLLLKSRCTESEHLENKEVA